MLQAISYPPLLAAVTAALVGTPAAAAAARAALWEPTAHQPPYTWPPQLPPDVARAVTAQTTRSCVDDDGGGGGGGGGGGERGDEDDGGDAATGSGRGQLEEGRREGAVRPETTNDAAVAGSGSLRATLLNYLLHHDTPLGGGVVLMLVTLMQNKEVPEALLEEVCILRQCP